MFNSINESKLSSVLTLVLTVLISSGCSDPSSKDVDVPKKKSTGAETVKPVYSEDSLKKAVRLYISPDNPRRSIKNISLKELTRGCVVAIDADDFESSNALSAKILESHPDNGYGNCAQGISQYNSLSGDIDMALLYLKKSVDIGPKEFYSGKSYEYLARIYYERKEIEKAIEMISRSMELEPRSNLKYSYRALMHRELGDDKKAELDYDKSVEINPTGTRVYFNRAKFYESKGRYDEALKDYETMAENSYSKDRKPDSKMILPYRYKALLYIKMGETEKAIEEATRILKLNPKDTDSYTMRGELFLKSKRYKQAISDFSEAIKLAPEERKAYRGRAEAYRKLNMPDKAILDEKMYEEIDKEPAERPI